MAKKTKDTEINEEKVPSFTLSADQPGHIFALRAAIDHLPAEQYSDLRKLLREFDLYEETHRQ